MNALLKYIANEPLAAVGFAGIYVFGSIEIGIRFWFAGYPTIAAFFLSSVFVFTKYYFKRLVVALCAAKTK